MDAEFIRGMQEAHKRVWREFLGHEPPPDFQPTAAQMLACAKFSERRIAESVAQISRKPDAIDLAVEHYVKQFFSAPSTAERMRGLALYTAAFLEMKVKHGHSIFWEVLERIRPMALAEIAIFAQPELDKARELLRVNSDTWEISAVEVFANAQRVLSASKIKLSETEGLSVAIRDAVKILEDAGAFGKDSAISAETFKTKGADYPSNIFKPSRTLKHKAFIDLHVKHDGSLWWLE